MTAFTKLTALSAGWLVAISALHLAVNVDWERLGGDAQRLNVAYIPVT
jgi:hypothetical protein